MSRTFEYFTILAEMRTGSNFLEANLNAVPGVQCLGEVFNPHFMGKKGRAELLGLTMSERNEDPFQLLDQIKAQDGFAGFRLFSDHDPRVLDHVLADPACAKIILKRAPVQSYVSLQIARSTGQWRLSNVQKRKSAKIDFDPQEFSTYCEELASYYARLEDGLQKSGQTAFRLAFEDVGSLAALNGLLRFLDVPERLERLSRATKRQNPGVLRDKLTNPDVLDNLDLGELGGAIEPVVTPARGGQVRSYVAARDSGILFQPVTGRTDPVVENWLAALDNASPNELRRGFNQKSLRQWKRRHPRHRSFTLVRHPVEHAHRAFCRHILMPGENCLAEIRDTLRSQFGVPLPEGAPGPDYDAAAHRRAFLGFLGFVTNNLAGQTALRIPAEWDQQHEGLRAISAVAPPDMVARAPSASVELEHLARLAGVQAVGFLEKEASDPVALSEIYDQEIEAATRAAYQRDYMSFGFGAWSEA